MRPPKALLLDMDDTILCDNVLVDGCWRTVCARFSPQLLGYTPETLYDTIRSYSVWYWSDPERHRLGRLNLDATRETMVCGALGRDNEAIARQIARAYIEARHQACCPFPGAIAALQQLRATGVRMALVTNGASDAQRAKIARFNLQPYFDAILIEGEMGFGKPDERVYRQALGILDTVPAEAWMVGDNLEWDVAGAQRVGIVGVWMDVGLIPPASAAGIVPDLVIEHLAALIPHCRAQCCAANETEDML